MHRSIISSIIVCTHGVRCDVYTRTGSVPLAHPKNSYRCTIKYHTAVAVLYRLTGPYQTPSPSGVSRISVVRLSGGDRRAICTNLARFEAYSSRTDFDESTDEPDQLYEAHEAAIFGLTQVTFKPQFTFTESQYLVKSEFPFLESRHSTLRAN